MFEVAILQLLKSNDFHVVSCDDKTRRVREGFTEIRGRGGWHQIDCPCDYGKQIPFIYPIRMLGEVKFFKSPVDKKYVREFIGVIKDIQENYFVSEDENVAMLANRKMDVGVFFSANGFNDEAEKLAYAHGIKTLSYKNHFLVNKIKDLITDIESNYFSVHMITKVGLNQFRRDFTEMITQDIDDKRMTKYGGSIADGYTDIIRELRTSIRKIETSFMGTTRTGVFLHFLGEEQFPSAMFYDRDDGICQVYYNIDKNKKTGFYLTIEGDESRFYFTPPAALDRAAIFGKSTVLQEKEELFGEVNININLQGINRNLTLRIDKGWLDSVRDRV